jgi:hypothetical protein
MTIFKFELGIKCKDVVTGFEGIVTDRCEHLNGCNTYGISPQKTEAGKPVNTSWFDENRIEITGKGIELHEQKRIISVVLDALQNNADGFRNNFKRAMA